MAIVLRGASSSISICRHISSKILCQRDFDLDTEGGSQADAWHAYPRNWIIALHPGFANTLLAEARLTIMEPLL